MYHKLACDAVSTIDEQKRVELTCLEMSSESELMNYDLRVLESRYPTPVRLEFEMDGPIQLIPEYEPSEFVPTCDVLEIERKNLEVAKNVPMCPDSFTKSSVDGGSLNVHTLYPYSARGRVIVARWEGTAQRLLTRVLIFTLQGLLLADYCSSGLTKARDRIAWFTEVRRLLLIVVAGCDLYGYNLYQHLSVLGLSALKSRCYDLQVTPHLCGNQPPLSLDELRVRYGHVMGEPSLLTRCGVDMTRVVPFGLRSRRLLLESSGEHQYLNFDREFGHDSGAFTVVSRTAPAPVVVNKDVPGMHYSGAHRLSYYDNMMRGLSNAEKFESGNHLRDLHNGRVFDDSVYNSAIFVVFLARRFSHYWKKRIRYTMLT